MKVKVLYFAALREQLGTSGEEIELPQGVGTVAALRAHLRGRGGAWQAALADGKIVARSLFSEEPFEVVLADAGKPRRGMWGDYVEGTARALMARGVAVSGASLLIDSDVPAGAGLSASAALETSVGLALASLAGRGDLDRVTLAEMACPAADPTGHFVGEQPLPEAALV